MAFWIFTCDPDAYRIDARLDDPNPAISWTVSSHTSEIGTGDTVFLWVTGRSSAIRAVLRIDQPPREMAELESERPYWAKFDTQVKWRVVASLVRRDVNLSLADLGSVKGMQAFALFQDTQPTTNLPLTAEQGELLLRLIGTPDGLITLLSQHTAAETVQRLEKILAEKHIHIFAKIDHASGAATAHLPLRFTTVVLFGNPLAGTPLMQSKQTIGIDLPLKALVWEDEAGKIWLTYNDPAFLVQRHRIHDRDDTVKAMSAGLQALTRFATGG